MNQSIDPAVQVVEGYIEGFVAVVPRLGIAALVFLVFMLAAAGAAHAVRSVLQRRDRSDLGRLLGSFVRWAVLLFGFLVFATIVFPSIKPADLLSTLGIGSVAIGFAFKDVLQNWLSGLLILYRRPFRPGDQIVSGAFEGTVERIEARATLIRTYDGELVVIPNSDIYTRAVTVRTAFPRRRSEYDVGIGYGDDVERACAVILAALKDVPEIEPDPPAEAIPWALDGSAVIVKVMWWSDPRRLAVVRTRGRVVAAIKRALSEAAIDLPFPTCTILLHDQTEEADGDRTRQREGWPAGSDPPRRRRSVIADAKGAAGAAARDPDGRSPESDRPATGPSRRRSDNGR
ncbi:mechanosensitive ion channel family protein [Rhodoplanes sp. TEM]|uniref:Small-conductance mechanosensitive channel n=1 Tax=Rhodoplanes tepidamans TaxID=200616 RepID=A0ABT5J5X2_RHOTP|nr:MULTISPECIES: mechanosensitive ion channel family protein [Rhodoplanes]MDC7785055.1 mechanosensitive ion channel family protein [Rhodoplanes tepidamans]MDC7982529.1 mechanosensitive ion channel family protein [Rhodoplanes sp. TEM]MDQ0356543.1 small-conductance mechanosensitive channel [Rhodoplanes tepidamans]